MSESVRLWTFVSAIVSSNIGVVVSLIAPTSCIERITLKYTFAVFQISPNCFRAKLFNRVFIGHERRVFDNCLRGEHTVERIAMFRIEFSGG